MHVAHGDENLKAVRERDLNRVSGGGVDTVGAMVTCTTPVDATHDDCGAACS